MKFGFWVKECFIQKINDKFFHFQFYASLIIVNLFLFVGPSVISNHSTSVVPEILPISIEIASNLATNNKTSNTVSTQTSSSLTAKSPRKEKLRKKIKSLKKQLTSKNKLQRLNFDDLLPKTNTSFIKSQPVLKNRKPVGRRYSQEIKKFALTLYFLGPKTYNFMQQLLFLSSKRCLELY